MVSALKISYAQTLENVLSITPSVAADTDNNCWNLIGGPRYHRFFYGSAATARNTVYDLGANYADKESTVDHMILAGADFLQDDGTTDITLESSPDNATWTTRIGINGFASETLVGPRQKDYVALGGPPVIGGCKLWLRSDRGTTVGTDGTVSQWNDYSGNSNNATQGTTANKPHITRSDNQENLVTYSQELSTAAAWDHTSYPVTMTDAASIDFEGETIASLMTATAGTSRHGVTWTNSGSRFVTVAAGNQYILEVDVKAGTFTYAWVGTSADSSWHGVDVNLSAGTFNGVGGSLASKSITDLGGGWYRVSLLITSVADHKPDCGIWFGSSSNDTSPPSVAAAGTETLYICRPQVRRVGTDSGYLRSQEAPQMAGINGHSVLVFDGNNDYLTCSGIASSVTGTDKPYSIFIVCRPDTLSGTRTLTSFSRSSTATPYETHRISGATIDSAKRDDASTTTNPNISGVTLATHIYSIITTGTSLSVYQDGTLLGTNTFDVGATTLDQAFIGVLYRAGAVVASTYFAGAIPEIILFDSAKGTTDRQAIEAYLTAEWVTNPSRETIFESPQARYWRVSYAGSSQVYRHSKCYFGKFFTFDYDPEYEINIITAKNSAWYASSGAAYFCRPSDPVYQIKVTATACSDDTVERFDEHIVRFAHLNPVFLHDIEVPQVLNNHSPIHCWLTAYSVEKIESNYNKITMVFEEDCG
jgi:hypothetical protein